MMKKLTIANAKISQIMTRDLVTVSLDSTVEEVVNKMVDCDVECLPVVDAEGVLRGLVTFRDIVMKVVYPLTKTRESQVEKIMSKSLVTCNPNSTVLDVVKIMKNKHLRRIPIVDAKNELVGLVTDFDLALFGWDFK
ncbi:MAG: CBS domain-containing protein [Candidatus Bathyarchaeota archaeon]|jgi:CBS domain-containing protein